MREELEDADGWLGGSVVKCFPVAQPSLCPVNIPVHSVEVRLQDGPNILTSWDSGPVWFPPTLCRTGLCDLTNMTERMV